MDDALGVRGLERIGNLNGQIEHLGEPERLSTFQSLPQRLPFEQLHGQQRLPVDVVDLVDRADVRVVQRRGGTRFALEALERGMVLRERWREKLERNVTPEFRVVGAIHHTHPPRADLVKDAIVRDDLANHLGGSRLPELQLLPSPRDGPCCVGGPRGPHAKGVRPRLARGGQLDAALLRWRGQHGRL